MKNIERFHVGEYLKDALNELGLTENEFADHSGIKESTLFLIIENKIPISLDIAYKLSTYFGNSINFWLNLQKDYNYYKKENEQKELLIEERNSFNKSFNQYFLNIGLFSESSTKEEKANILDDLINVFHLNFVKEEKLCASFKTQKGIKHDFLFEKNLWLSIAIQKAKENVNIKYNKEKLLELIPKIKRICFKKESCVLNELKNKLSECGVTFVFVPYLSKSNVYGATTWLDNEHVMIAISNRGERIDLFWFSLFHEIAHVLMEHRKSIMFNLGDKEEKEADQVASNLLISKDKWGIFLRVGEFSINKIISFAKENNVLPCIVLGRLYKEKIIPYGKFSYIFNVKYESFKKIC